MTQEAAFPGIGRVKVSHYFPGTAFTKVRELGLVYTERESKG